MELEWEDPRGNFYAPGVCIDISTSGMRVKTREAVPDRAYVRFRMKGMTFQGSGRVRSVTRIGIAYQLGVEFGQGVVWSDKLLPATASSPAGKP